MALPQPKAISQLDLASPLTSADQFVVVQNGVTKKALFNMLASALDTSCQCTLVSRFDRVCTGADTIEKYFQTYTLPGGVMTSNGDWLEIYATGTAAANINTKTIYFNFGAIKLEVSGPFNDVAWKIDIHIQRITEVRQKISLIYYDGRTFGAGVNKIVEAYENLAYDIPISISGMNSVANVDEICNESFIIKLNKVDTNT